MKTLFKIIVRLLIFIIVVIVIPLLVFIYFIYDNTDEAPVELYTSNVTFENELTSLLDDGFDLSDKDTIDLTFTTDEMNRIIYAVVRDSINPEYSPANGSTDDEKYIMTEYYNVPVLGNQKVRVKHIYTQIVDNKLHLYVTLDLMGISSRAKMIATFSETADAFVITFENVGLGKSNLLSGIMSDIMFWILDKLEITEATANMSFEDNQLPFVLDLENYTLTIDKDNVSQLLEKIINSDEVENNSEKEMLAELVTSLTAKENDIVDFGVFGDSFGLRFDLNKLTVDPELVVLDDEITTFNEQDFIQNQVENFIISNLVPTANSKMVFTNLRFNQILYNQSNGYEQFKTTITIPNSNSEINIQITGILIDFNANDVIIRINCEINGLVTSIKLIGNIQNNNSPQVRLKITDSITVGEDLDEVIGDYLTANSSLIISLLSQNIKDMGIMEYSTEQKAFILEAASFTQLMTVEGGSDTPLTVDKVNIIDNGIEMYVSINPADPIFTTVIEVTQTVKDVLSDNPFTTDDFDTTDPTEAADVNAILETLTSVEDGINNDTLTEETTDEFINNFNNLSDENQQVILDTIESIANSPELLSLYDSFFGR